MQNNYNETNNYSKRLSRYTNVGKEVGKFTTKFLVNSIISDNKSGKNAVALKTALGSLKGPLMKIAQLLSTIPGALPPEYTEELSQLQNMAPPMGKGFVRRRMNTELGLDWADNFINFEYNPFAAASLGQVHKAKTKDENDVVCKLQYPNMISAVEADLKQLDLIFKINKNLDPAIGTDKIREEIAERLREELDYKREASHLKLFSRILKDHNDINIPDLFENLSTDKLLVMSFLNGKPLMNYKHSSQEIRNRIAECLFRAWWVPFGQFGVIHGDPHLGNYSVCEIKNEVSGINLLDFGCVRRFRPPFVEGVINLYNGLKHNNSELIISSYELWGFKNLNKELIETLNIWANFIYGPILDDRSRTVADGIKPEMYGRKEAFNVYQLLKKIGPVEIPREFVFMDRAAIGLGSVFLHLNANLNLHDLFEEAISGFNAGKLLAKQTEIFEKTGVDYGH